MATATSRPRFAAEQEIRFAVVMYGGVSLAIYINGVAQELFRLVQATAPAVTGDQAGQVAHHPDVGDGALTGSARVYRELGQRLGIAGFDAAATEPDAARRIRTRFVVDILSGTSAGGLNGVLLAKALANEADFGPSRDLWIEVADIGQLLARAFGPLRSLLDGDRLYREARTILAALGRPGPGSAAGPGEGAGIGEDGGDARTAGRPGAGTGDDRERPAPSPYVEQLDLAVTATDLAGLPTTLALRYGDGVGVAEPEHRTVLEFGRGTVATSGADHCDFQAGCDRLLAFAGRATSSFPFAFEPVALGALPHHPADAALDADAKASEQARELRERLFAEHRVRGVDPDAVWFADGGYLDNKPFSYATRALRRRRADVPVTRRLLYVEPDPALERDARDLYDGRPPSLYRNVLAATVGLRGFEPIRSDIADLAERNGRVARLRAIEQDAARTIASLGPDALSAIDRQPGHAAYRNLRLRMTLDRLAEAAAALGGWDVDDDSGRAARAALRAWAEPLTGEERVAELRGWLDGLDVAFQHRRASFLHDRINELLHDARPAPFEQFAEALGCVVCSVAADDGTIAAELRAAKRGLNDALVPLHAAEWPLTRPPGEGSAVRSAASEIARNPGRFAEAMRAYLREPLAQAQSGIADAQAAVADRTARDLLQAYDSRFELFDLVVLPLAYPALGEVNVTEVWRVSPRDARGIPVEPRLRLAGTRLHHFGGFLDREWRRNDLLWGRLDGAEAILAAVLPGLEHERVRRRFRVAAQAAILREELDPAEDALARELRERLGPERYEHDDEALVEEFARRWRAPAELTARRRAALLLRVAPRVVATLVKGLRPGRAVERR